MSRVYENGRGVPQGGSEAIRWYRLAVDHGHAGAQFNLGHVFDLPLDEVRALSEEGLGV